MKKILLASLLSALSMGAANAQITTNMQSTAKLESLCVISAQDMSFGEINVMGYNGAATGGLNILCSKGVSYTIRPIGGYDAGSQLSAWHLLRGTTGNTDALRITLQQEEEGKIWSGLASRQITGVGTGSQQSHVVRAKLMGADPTSGTVGGITNAKNELARPDIYSGSVTAQITY